MVAPIETPLAGRTALVTGGGHGLGQGIALGLARAGAAVAVLARTRQQLDGTVAQIEAQGGRAVAVVADVTDRGAVEAGVAQAERSPWPGLDTGQQRGPGPPVRTHRRRGSGRLVALARDPRPRNAALHERRIARHAGPSHGMHGQHRVERPDRRRSQPVVLCVAKATVIRLTEHVDAEGARRRRAGVRRAARHDHHGHGQELGESSAGPALGAVPRSRS